MLSDKGASYDMAGWEHNAPGLTPELRATFLRSSVGHGTLPEAVGGGIVTVTRIVVFPRTLSA